MIEFFREWGILIVAVAALLQPWAIVIYDRFFRPGTIDIHETGTLEVGYSGFGATVSLHGTLRALNQDQFVRSIELTLIREKDSSRHEFEWGVFRARRLTVGQREEVSVELPYGFMLTTTQPRRYDIVFFDMALQSEARPYLQGVREAWTKMALATPSTPQTSLNAAYETFSKTDPHVKAFSALDRLCYWDPGRYSLEMRVNTARPGKTFSRHWTFELSVADSNGLRLNSIRVIYEACGQPFGLYHFAYPKYGEGRRKND